MLSATTSTLFIATTKVAAVGRHHKRGAAAASGRGTSFVVPFVVSMNRVDVVDLVVDLVDVNLDVDLVDVDLDVNLVDVDLVDILRESFFGIITRAPDVCLRR